VAQRLPVKEFVATTRASAEMSQVLATQEQLHLGRDLHTTVVLQERLSPLVRTTVTLQTDSIPELMRIVRDDQLPLPTVKMVVTSVAIWPLAQAVLDSLNMSEDRVFVQIVERMIPLELLIVTSATT
jgi:hypothetical protein